MKFIIIVLIVFSIVKITSIIWVSKIMKPKPMTPKEIEEYDRKEDQKDGFDF